MPPRTTSSGWSIRGHGRRIRAANLSTLDERRAHLTEELEWADDRSVLVTPCDIRHEPSPDVHCSYMLARMVGGQAPRDGPSIIWSRLCEATNASLPWADVHSTQGV